VSSRRVASAAGSDVSHIPHLLIPGPWDDAALEPGHDASHHLTRVLRRRDGDPISYTDGRGRLGTGRLERGAVVRGNEVSIPRPAMPVLAVAPPTHKDRTRFLIEKLAELGVQELRWLRTRFGEGRVPAADKVEAWCRSAVEQSRSAWMMVVRHDLVDVGDLPEGTVFADRSGRECGALAGVPCVAVGPEGGWAVGEFPVGAHTLAFASGVLRVETAAIAAAVLANRIVG